MTLLNETLEVKLNKDISVPAQVNLLSSEIQTNEIICKSITNSWYTIVCTLKGDIQVIDLKNPN